MPSYLQSSGAISIGDLKTFFGGPAAPSISNYYRGGSYTPSTITSITTEGPSYNRVFRGYWSENTVIPAWPLNRWTFYWGYVTFGNYVEGGATTYTTGGWTYMDGGTGYGGSGTCCGGTVYYRSIKRQQTTNVAANTGLPSSGAISLSQFYGAVKS